MVCQGVLCKAQTDHLSKCSFLFYKLLKFWRTDSKELVNIPQKAWVRLGISQRASAYMLEDEFRELRVYVLTWEDNKGLWEKGKTKH